MVIVTPISACPSTSMMILVRLYTGILRGPGSSEVFRVCGKEREEVAGDVPEDADDAAGRQGCFRVVEFGRERHP